MASKAKVLVIGGSSGMGKAAAAACIAAGYEVTIAGRSKEKLAAAAAVIGGGVSSVELDVTDSSATEAVFAAIPAGTYKHLVVTMGASVGGPSVLGAEGFAKLKQQMDAKFFAQVSRVAPPKFNLRSRSRDAPTVGLAELASPQPAADP